MTVVYFQFSMALAYKIVHLSAFIGHIALPGVMSTCGKIFNQDFKQVTTPYQYTLSAQFVSLQDGKYLKFSKLME
ncbi:Uncharacterized protein FWK35_00012998 [Aphis craccivora]|uniref:Uncharacterized protein n=1 Tax=Aphis craccivora TaxID=307492 RepID=A0A6G0YWB3_APHCR|nr:Uncharacterized protein FWK35_00012998 [Aphis craccivora]